MTAILRRALITGATGFLGRHLATLLVTQQWSVVALARCAAAGPWEQIVALDLEHQVLPTELLAGTHTVFHLAARTHAVDDYGNALLAYRRANVDVTDKLLAQARDCGVKCFVFVSSVKAMGDGSANILDEESDCAPLSAYGISKYEAEQCVLARGVQMRVVVLRLPLMYGVGVKGNLATLLRRVDNGHVLPLPEFANRRSFVSANDAARLLVQLAIDKRAAGEVFILTDGQDCSTRQLLDQMRRVCGRPIPRWALPRFGLHMLARFGDGVSFLCRRHFLFDSVALAKLSNSARYSSAKVRQRLKFNTRDNLEHVLPSMLVAMRHSR